MAESPERSSTQRSERAPTEARLTFILARHAVTRWQFDSERLRRLASSKSRAKRALALMESELGLTQIKALVRRIQPLTTSQDVAERFEAEETLVALDAVAERLDGTLGRVRAQQQPQDIGPADATAAIRAKPGDVPSTALALASAHQAARFDSRFIDHLLRRAPGHHSEEAPAATAAAGPPEGSTPPAPSGHGRDFEQAVRETAYFSWEQDGRPEGRGDDYWQRALAQIQAEVAGEKADGGEIPRADVVSLQGLGNGATRESAAREPPSSAPVARREDQETMKAFSELAAALSDLWEELDLPQPSVRARRERPHDSGGPRHYLDLVPAPPVRHQRAAFPKERSH